MYWQLNKNDSRFYISKHTTKISDEHLTKWTSTKNLVEVCGSSTVTHSSLWLHLGSSPSPETAISSLIATYSL
jgi:hypothetical protein